MATATKGNLPKVRRRAKVGDSIRSPSLAGRARNPADGSTYSGQLALHVQALREAKGLTVEGLAEKIGVPLSTMYAYEGGTRGIPADLFPVLARALGVTAAEFLPKFPKK